MRYAMPHFFVYTAYAVLFLGGGVAGADYSPPHPATDFRPAFVR